MRNLLLIIFLLITICMSAQTKSKTEQNKAVTEEQTNSGVEASRKLFLASSFKDVAKLFADFTGE